MLAANCSNAKTIMRKVIGNRLNVYREQTEPLVEFYEKLGKLKTVDADGTIDEVYARFLQQIE